MFISITIVIFILAGSFFGYKFFIKDLIMGKPETLVKPENPEDTNIVFLHHSTGERVWDGGVKEWFDDFNRNKERNLSIKEQNFPKREGYGWKNYPYDYWNIWVNHAGNKPYKNEPTLEIITEEYDIVIFKHCFPVGRIERSEGEPDVSSSKKTIENYKLQYNALKEKMRSFPETKFIVWTGAALTEETTNEEMANRARSFFDWVKEDWDQKDDNIYIWDFYGLQTEGGPYIKEEYSKSPSDPHPNQGFSEKVTPLFCQRIVDVIDGTGDIANITGESYIFYPDFRIR